MSCTTLQSSLFDSQRDAGSDKESWIEEDIRSYDSPACREPRFIDEKQLRKPSFQEQKEKSRNRRKMGVIISLPLGITRTLVGLVQRFVLRQNKPLRIDLPLPFIPIDVVLVSDASQIVTIARDPDVDRLHAHPTEKLPSWTQWYFSGTRYYNKVHGTWFLAFSPKTESSQYDDRIKHYWDKLDQGFEEAYVKEIAGQVLRNDSEEQIALTLTRMINLRFMSEKSQDAITPEVVGTAREVLKSSLLDALQPGHQRRGVAAQKSLHSFCQRHMEEGKNASDATHNISSASTIVVDAVMTLKKNINTPIEHLFTRKANCPTPSIPRVVTKATTLNGLLSYPAKPGSTILFLSISSAAEQTSSLFFTLGSGSEYRVCAFKDFFYNFMTALQAELKARRSEIRNGTQNGNTAVSYSVNGLKGY
ncbi:hypothetical protein R1sor_016525 [Riccia sorocarpa]|uniref:Uncharacterized protein n=1 Tax=Riccia sorocarpa TaxID=122646 RepID=A0ABD3HH94_9MARC